MLVYPDVVTTPCSGFRVLERSQLASASSNERIPRDMAGQEVGRRRGSQGL